MKNLAILTFLSASLALSPLAFGQTKAGGKRVPVKASMSKASIAKKRSTKLHKVTPSAKHAKASPKREVVRVRGKDGKMINATVVRRPIKMTKPTVHTGGKVKKKHSGPTN